MARYYDFFFSFASVDWRKGKKDDMEAFFKDLEAKLTSFGFSDGGFFAPDDIGRGREWEQRLAEALPASRVLVPLYSPNYFKSVWCGREWEIFWQRQKENMSAPPPDVKKPDVILPVIWTAEFLELPSRVPKVQHSAGNDTDAYKTRGLGYMMQSPRRFSTKYDDFVRQFATELAVMVKDQGAAKMRWMPEIDELDLPFPGNYKRGLSHVRYVFLAGRRDEMQKMRTKLECYGKFETREDWRPCFPDVDRLAGDLARSVSSENGKAYEFVEARDAAMLLQAVRDARSRKNVVAVIVDPWSLSLHSMKEFAEKFDAEEFPTSGVIVTWNEKDAETKEAMPVLKNRVGDHFRGRTRRQEYYNDGVRSLDELRDALVAVFSAAQERLVEGGQIRPAVDTERSSHPLLHITP